MNGVRTWLMPPTPGAEPAETLRWVRRIEIVTGLLLIGLGVAFYDGWWRWGLIAFGVLSLAPWPGAAAILRKADRKPDILISDPQRRRARGRQMLKIMVLVTFAFGVAYGYVIDGWTVAIITGVLAALCAGVGGRWALRREET